MVRLYDAVFGVLTATRVLRKAVSFQMLSSISHTFIPARNCQSAYHSFGSLTPVPILSPLFLPMVSFTYGESMD